jgi:hypothetical protein
MPKSNQSIDFKSTAGYQRLLRDVKRVLLEGQRKIEQERVRTYLEAGRIIHTHILKYARATRGQEIVRQLALDLGVSETVLHRCIKFFQKYPALRKVARGPLITWSHYRKLIVVPEKKERLRLEKLVTEKGWTAEELAVRIKGDTVLDDKADSPATVIKSAVDNRPITPLLGTLYTYRLVERPNLSAGSDPEVLVDIGFGIYHSPDKKALSGFVKDQIVEFRPRERVGKFCKSGRTAKDLFTYLAYVERVIDGDTVKVRLDLGFNVWTRQTLRLRALDCPELGTAAGDEARDFVRSHLKEAQQIIVRSSRADKYDRYLADLFIPPAYLPGPAVAPAANPAAYIYLNNLLLETGRAVRMG